MKLIHLSLLVSLLWHPICYLIDNMIEDYDKSTELVIDNQYLKHAIRWDSLFFQEIMNNGYRYFKNHAFGSGMIVIGRILLNSIPLLLILQKLCNAISTALVYHVSLLYTNSKEYSQIAALLFIFTPASAFFNSLYSESYFTVLVLGAIYLKLKHQPYWSALLFSLSIHFRSNGMFYVLYSGYPYLQKAFYQLKDRKWKPLFLTISEAIPIALIYLVSVGIMLYIPYRNYCSDNQMDWCKGIIPYAYGYIQKNFWDVSFLSSYKPRKAFFIYWGIQGLLIEGVYLYQYWKKQTTIKMNAESIAIMLPTLLLYLVTALVAHVNCSTRFFSTSIVFYWALADLLQNKSTRKIILFYLIEFNLGGLILFSNYLLWA